MAQRAQATIGELRRTIACLPRATRVAMLDGIADNEIVVGAYTHDGGICPMLAAHRNGGRTNFIAFAKAWDRFTLGRSRQRQARPATVRELLVLRSHLEASLLEDDGPAPDLRRAIAEHRELRARAITAPEPIRDPGWRWLRRRRERRTERQLELAERG